LGCSRIALRLSHRSTVELERTLELTAPHQQTSQQSEGILMKSWPVQDAKARFSEFLQATLTRGPQLVTMRGTEAAVLVPVEEWRRLNARARPGLKDLLLDPETRSDLPIPAREKLQRRPPKEIA